MKIQVNSTGGLEVPIDNLISVSDASRRGVSWLVRQVDGGEDMVVLRNSKPVAAVVGIETMAAIKRAEELCAARARLNVLAQEIVTNFIR